MTRMGLVTCLFLSSLTAAGEPVDYGKQFDSCLARNKGQPITGTIGNCADEVAAIADAELNSLAANLDALLLQNAPIAAKTFQAAQRAWLDYQEATCQLSGEFVAGIEYARCPMYLKIARIKELRELQSSLAMTSQ